MKTLIRQNTQPELYHLWNSQPVEFREESGYSRVTVESQSVQSLRTRTDDVLDVVAERQFAGDCDAEYLN